MSGPKSSTYSVESQALARARRLRAAQGRCNRLLDDMQVLSLESQAAVTTWGITPLTLHIPSDAIPDTEQRCSEFARRLTETLESAREDLGIAVRQANSASIAASLGGKFTSLSVEVNTSKPRKRSRNSDSASSGPAIRLAKLAERAAGLADRDLISRISALTEQVPHLDGSSLEMEILSLQLAIQVTRDKAEAMERRRTMRSEFLTSLDGYSSTEVDLLRAEIVATDLATDLPKGIEQRVTSAVEDCNRREESEFASAAITESLESLGYAVGPDFAVSIASSTGGIIDLPGRPNYGVRVRVQGERRKFDFNVVRFGGDTVTSPSDIDAEASWCRDLDVVRELMSAAEVPMAMTRQTDPGAIPVQVVAPRRTEPRKRKRTQPKERSI